MRDNKPLEMEAVSLIRHRLAQRNLKTIVPDFDEFGSDILLLNTVDRNLYKSIVVQSKGRNITTNNSNVKIPLRYVDDDFVLFLYLKVDGSFDDNLFMFVKDDIVQWIQRKGNYYLNIPRNAIETAVFDAFRYDEAKWKRLKAILDRQLITERNKLFVRSQNIFENIFQVWRLSGSLPDAALTSWLKENEDFIFNPAYEVLITGLLVLHSASLTHEANIDSYVPSIQRYNGLSLEGTIVEREVIESVHSDWVVTYRHVYVQKLKLSYRESLTNAIRLHIEDEEEVVQCLLLDNEEIEVRHTKK
jgi:hypothetical protein